MKSIIICLFTCMASFSYAADLFVQEFGGGGTFATITDAITASSNGDRILVQPKSGNAPYIESLTINKAIQILTASNGNRFVLQGSISVATSLALGSTVVIDGVQINVGSISQTTASTNAVNVFVVNSVLQSGFIRFGQRFNVTIANNTVTGTSSTSDCIVDICRGNILGNTVNGVECGIRVQNDAINNTDTLYIVGNRVNISSNFSFTFFLGINWACNTAFCFIANNYLQSTAPTNNQNLGASTFALLNMATNKPSTNSSQRSVLMNNTAVFNVTTINSSYTYLGMTSTNDPSILFFNNLVHYNSTTPGSRTAYSIPNGVQFSYNNASSASTFNSTSNPDVTNTSTNVTINTTTGCLTNNPDLGHPNAIFTDLDLTRNDWGACGGSYNASLNYFNTSVAGTAKVHLLVAPRRVLQGGTLSIEAEGHDR